MSCNLSIGSALLASLAGVLCFIGSGCGQSVPSVPPSNRTVVQPRGSTDVMKSWNRTTKQEGDAILGPLSAERR